MQIRFEVTQGGIASFVDPNSLFFIFQNILTESNRRKNGNDGYAPGER